MCSGIESCCERDRPVSPIFPPSPHRQLPFLVEHLKSSLLLQFSNAVSTSPSPATLWIKDSVLMSGKLLSVAPRNTFSVPLVGFSA